MKTAKQPWYKQTYPKWSNVIIKNSNWEESDIKYIFEDLKGESDKEIEIIDAKDIEDLCVKLTVYPSRQIARKAGRTGEIPKGYTKYKAAQKYYIFIWNPNENI